MKTKMTSLVIPLILVATVFAFQNCGQGFSVGLLSSSSLSISGKVIEGNAVKEANLMGAHVLRSQVRGSAVGAQASSELVTCSSDSTNCLAQNMPLLSQLQMPTPDAGMYCAPTASGMLFDAMLNSGVQFPRGNGPEFTALRSSAERVLWLGRKFKTDQNGTYPIYQTLAIDDLAFSATPGYELKTPAIQTVTPSFIVQTIKNRSIAALNYGHFQISSTTTLISGRQTATTSAHGGHAVAVAGFRNNSSGETEIIYNDPWDATQYSRVFTRDSVQGADGIYVVYPYTSEDGQSSPYSVFKWNDGFSQWVELLTYYSPIQPRVLPNQPAVDPARAAAEKTVIEVYRALLGREPDAAGLEQSIAYLLAGNSRAQLEDQIRASQEYKNRNRSQTPTPTPKPSTPSARPTDALVKALFQGLLQRAPEAAALEYASGLNCQGIGEMVALSNEVQPFYQARDNGNFVLYLYQGLLGRTSELWEIHHWQAEIDSGRLSREGVIRAFVVTPEFKNRCQSMGVQ